MTGITTTESGTNAGSTDSGQGTDPLSDAFVAISRDLDQRVEAPEGSSHLSIQRSSRVASSRSRSMLQTATSTTSVSNNIKVSPGTRCRPGYVYQLLSPTIEDSGPKPNGSAGNASGFWDTAIPQSDPKADTPNLGGRKRSATSAASGSTRLAPGARHLASAADFSPTHFNEPVSDIHIPAAHSSPQQQSVNPQSSLHQQLANPALPMQAEPTFDEAPPRLVTPFSSPILQNLLLGDKQSMVMGTPSPTRQRSASFRTRDSNAAWATAQGLLPIPEGFSAPGSVPVGLVGGVTYSIHSPQKRQSTVPRSDVGRQLFAEQTSIHMHGHGQQQPEPHSSAPHAPSHIPAGTAPHSGNWYSVCCSTLPVHAYTDSCIVRPAG
jgi:hypothetical protein